MGYVIITPAKNEAKFIQHTLDSVIAQTLLPDKWIIVDDGSTDETQKIVKQYTIKYPWIHLAINRHTMNQRVGGAQVVRVFASGLEALTQTRYDFIVKLDADLTLPANYFSEIQRCFKKNERVGICGGIIVNKYSQEHIIPESVPEFHIRGAFKAYRMACFKNIQGLKPVYNWDGIDELEAMYHGWQTQTLSLNVIHHRPTGTLTNKGYRWLIEDGKEYFRMGYDPLLALLKAIHKGRKAVPRVISGVLFFWGFWSAFFARDALVVDRQVSKFSRRFQYNRLFKRVGR